MARTGASAAKTTAICPQQDRTTARRKRVLAFADEHHVTVAELTTGEVLSVHLIEPNKSYWRNQTREPGRWPSLNSETYVATQV